MQPVLFHLPLPGGHGLPIHAYPLMVGVAFFAGAWIIRRGAERRGLPPFGQELCLVVLVSGVVGARALYCLQNSTYYAGASPLEVLAIWRGGLVFYGGALCALIAGGIYIRTRRLPARAAFDVATPGVALGMALGRVGCFLQGCCFGRPCDPTFPLGVIYPRGSEPHFVHRRSGWLEAAGPVHPVQLYEVLLWGVMFGVFWRFSASRAGACGSSLPCLILLYGVGRFYLEGFRGDHGLRSGLTSGQELSVAAVALGGMWLAFDRARAGRHSQTEKPPKNAPQAP